MQKLFRSLFMLVFLSVCVFAQKVPAPKDVLGFTPGDDRKLASWAQVVDYFQQLAKASNRQLRWFRSAPAA